MASMLGNTALCDWCCQHTSLDLLALTGLIRLYKGQLASTDGPTDLTMRTYDVSALPEDAHLDRHACRSMKFRRGTCFHQSSNAGSLWSPT